MEIKYKEKVGNKYYFIVKSYPKLIKISKVLEIIGNIKDYINKDKELDLKLLEEEVLEIKEYSVIIDKHDAKCSCKNGLFRKTPCRHIKFCLEELKNGY